MLTEREIARTWSRLFREGPYNEETFTKAEGLIEQLRAESPLRARLSDELEEIRRTSAAEA